LPLARAIDSSKTRQRKSRDRFTVRARNSEGSEFFPNPA
jgi:hypothetical protein